MVEQLVQIHKLTGMIHRALFLAVHIMDRFLSVEYYPGPNLNLGLISLLIAAKYEQQNHPKLVMLPSTLDIPEHWICVMTGSPALYVDTGRRIIIYMERRTIFANIKRRTGFANTRDCTWSTIANAERHVLSILGYELGWPAPLDYLLDVDTIDDSELALIIHLLERTLLDSMYLRWRPSLIAHAAVSLSRILKTPTTKVLAPVSMLPALSCSRLSDCGHTNKDIREVVYHMCSAHPSIVKHLSGSGFQYRFQIDISSSVHAARTTKVCTRALSRWLAQE